MSNKKGHIVIDDDQFLVVSDKSAVLVVFQDSLAT